MPDAVNYVKRERLDESTSLEIKILNKQVKKVKNEKGRNEIGLRDYKSK